MSLPVGNMTNTTVLTKRELYLIISIPLLFVLLSLIHLDKPGVQYDEILFGNAALGGIDGSFITKKIGDLPVMLMPYIGALKAYIFYPIFKIFPMSPYTIRIPVIIFGIFTLLFTFKYVNSIFDKRIAFVTILLFAFDPSFVNQNRLDWGPVSIALLCKSLALFSLTKWLTSRQKRYVIFAFIYLGLGLFNKLDFIWFINALALGVCIVFFREIISISRENVKLSASVLISLLACLSLFFLHIARMSSTSFNAGLFTFDLMERLTYQYHNFASTLGGSGAYIFMTNKDLPFSSLFLPIGSFLILLAFVMRVFLKVKLIDKRISFFAVILTAILLQIFITAKATGTHHIMMIYPFPHLIVAYFIIKVIDGFNKHNLKKFFIGIAYTATGIIIVSNLYVNFQYTNAFSSEKTSMMWSGGIYNLIEYIKENNEKTYVSLDWGLHTQLLTFTKGTVPLKEMVWTFNDLHLQNDIEKTEHWLIEAFICKPDYVFLLHKDNVTHFMKAKRNFIDLINKYNLNLKLVMSLGNGEKDYYELYEIDTINCKENTI